MAEQKSKVEKSRKKTGGRVAGTPNKKSQDIMDKLKAIGCDPIKGMADIAKQAMQDGEGQDLQLAGSMYKELAQYVAPKRKAIELTGSNDRDLLPSIIQIVHE